MSSTTKKRNSLTTRRLRNAMWTFVALALLVYVVLTQNQNLIRSTFTTGYVLMGCLLFLTAFNLRKRLPYLPRLGTAACWMQLHIYVGLSTFLIFGFHVAWRVPSGGLEILLAALYLIVAFSGVYGLYVTRVIPPRLTALGDEVIFERIPAFRRQLAEDARTLVLQACEQSDVLARFYSRRLAVFFERSPSLAYLAKPSGRVRRQLISEIQDLDRYLADDQRSVSRELTAMVQKKDDLDYHWAQQGRLKIWLFAHIGFTYSLLIVSILHGVMAHAFGGGLR